MPYLGNIPSTVFSGLSYQDLTGGTGTSFTLDYSVSSAQDIEVFVNNVRQEPGVAYTTAGTTLTMTGSIAATDDFYVVFQAKTFGTVSHPAGNSLQATTGTFSSNVDVGGSLFVDTIKEGTGTTTAMTIDSSGLVSLPNSVYLSRFGLTSNLTADGTLTDWSAPTIPNQVATIGTAVTASSGLFTFPVTGVWRVHLNARLLTVSDTSIGLVIDITTDNGSNYTETLFASEGDGASTTNTGSIVITEYVNVDDVSNVKVRFRAESIAASSYVQGQAVANGLRTWVSFERITDAQ